jgi:hypothetical protein
MRRVGDIEFKWLEDEDSYIFRETNTFEGDNTEEEVKSHKEELKRIFKTEKVESTKKSGKVQFTIKSKSGKLEAMTFFRKYISYTTSLYDKDLNKQISNEISNSIKTKEKSSEDEDEEKDTRYIQ